MKKLASVVTHRSKDGGGTEEQLTQFWHDGIGRLTETIFPDTTFERNTYQFGQVQTWKTRKNQVKTISYDARGREVLNGWSAPPSNPPIPLAPGVSRVWDDANRLTSIANVFSTIDYTYDDAGQAKWEGNTVIGSGGRNQITYYRYPSGEISQITYPTGPTVVNRNYTARGQLKDVGWGAGATSYVYHPDGKVNVQVRTAPNSVTTSYGYDGRGMIGRVQHSKDGHDLVRRDYWRDERDRIVAWKRGTDTHFNGMEDGRGNRYGYDEEGQLTSASYRAVNPEGTPSGALRTDSFAYDELGNRMGDSHVANRGQWMTMARRDNGLNQYLLWNNDPEHPVPDPAHWGSPVLYDDNFGSPWLFPGNGVMMAEGFITASYNALNQPVAIWVPNYGTNYMWFGYDPLGRCVKRWKAPESGGTAGYTPATFYYYDGWNMVQEGATSSSADRTYVHGGRIDEIVASNVNGAWYNHHYDAQGNCILLSTAAGGVAAQFDYDAFGYPYVYNASGGKGTALTRFLFTGREWISDLRIYDYRHRMYQPELGRFLQPDPIQFKAGDYNLYRYCHNDPINKTDPFGLFESPAWVQAIIPGQVEWDAAVTHFQAGNYGMAAAFTGAMFGQQFAAAFTLGASHRVNAPIQATRAAIVTAPTTRTVVQEVNLAGRIAESGMTTSQAGKFFGWGSREITKPLSGFTREGLQAAGWTQQRLQNVAAAYTRLAAETNNPSAAMRADQLTKLSKLFDEK